MEAVRVSRKFLLLFKTCDFESKVKLVSLTGFLQGSSAAQMLAWRVWVVVYGRHPTKTGMNERQLRLPSQL